MVLQTSAAIWTHMVVILEIMTTQPNLGSFLSVCVSEGETVSEFGSVSHSLANLWWLAATAKKIDWGWSKRQNNDKCESKREAVPYSRDAWHALGKANKQHKCSSKYFAYTIKYKIVIGIGTKIQSTPGSKHDQINTALITHHLEVGFKWTLAESSAQFSLSSYVIVGRSNHLSTNEQFLVRWRK